MKITNRIYAERVVLMIYALVFSTFSALAQYTITGSNAPGTYQDFVITNLPVSVTNLTVSVDTSATVFSHLLIKKGVPPSDVSYDFIAAENNGYANAINLEAPEYRRTNWILRVRTPTNSLTHNFTVTVATNVLNLRTITRSATKSMVATNTGLLGVAGWHYFRVEIPANVSGWRVQLSSTNNGPDLYIQRSIPPDSNQWLKRSQTLTNDDIAFATSELTPGAYYIGVFQPSGTTPYTLRTEIITFNNLTWDPGLTHLGTQVYTNASTNAGDYFFKITVENTSLGAWRTALNVSTGSASIYLAKGTPPSIANNLYDSERTNSSNGFVISSANFNAGEDWYYLVRAKAGARWNLVSGEPFVTDLGTVATNSSSGSGNVTVGAESMRFFQTTLPGNAVAWRLWLNGITNSVLVKKIGVPVVGATDQIQNGQMLVVPSYLVGGQQYFVGVVGNPGATINLDSRLQTFTDIPFLGSTNLNITGYPYATFRVTVPSDQLAWQMSVASTNSNPNIAVRRNFIPNENYNDAFSEVGSNITDSITLVPPTLSDGTFYITVYGSNSFNCTLQSGNPEFTEISYVSTTLNTDTNRTGWRFFKVSNIAEQLGTLGWDLYVTNHTPGTRIALRRNAAPGIWNYRNPNAGTAGTFDYGSTTNFLQRPGHQADVWYVGVFNTNAPLGPFTLVTRELTADPMVVDGGTATRVSVPAGKWQFFRIDVPNDILGWDIRLTGVTAGAPQLVVRRELLPVSLQQIGFSLPIILTNWSPGNQWAAGADWTGRNFSPDGTVNESGRILTMGYGRPVEAATYYIGVISPAGATNDMSYTLLSRAIGPGRLIDVHDLNYTNATTDTLPAREIEVYRVSVPTNLPSWKVRLGTNNGDVVLAVAKDRIPNISALANGAVTNILTAGKKMLKFGNEHFVELPSSGVTNVTPGLYYLLVASEGLVSSNATRIGTGAADFTLTSGIMPEFDLGILTTNDIVQDRVLEGGEATAFHFHNDPETLGFEVSMENRVGNPVIVSRGTMDLADPGAQSTSGGSGSVGPDPYGNDLGQSGALQASSGLITVVDPFPDETVMVKARGAAGSYPDAEYRLRIRKLVAPPLTFDGGFATVINQTNIYQFFRVDVPADALGWDCRITNTTGAPLLMIGRGFLPLNLPIGWSPGYDPVWPFYEHWIAGKDWTGRSLSPEGTNVDGRILAMGMGHPLEPDTYYVGVYNPNAPVPMNYTILSRGIGGPYAIPVVDLPFTSGIITNNNLRPREAAYYRVVIPDNSMSWQVKLTAQVGESMLIALTNSIPNVLSGKPGSLGKLMQKSGNEHFIRLPGLNQLSLPPGVNYLAVIGEGVNVTNNNRIGTGTNRFVLESRGEAQVINLGEVSLGNDLINTNSLQGGETRIYQFSVPDGLTSLEAQLLNVTGNPVMVLRTTPIAPYPGAASTINGAGSVSADDYGNEGGYPIVTGNGNANTNLISVANPSNGVYTVEVKARGIVAGVYSNATYKLVVRATTYLPVDFDGGTVVVTNQAANTWRYYRVEVPPEASGWDIRLANVTAGQPKLVVSRDVLPASLVTASWGTPGIATLWPTTNQWAAGSDWTRRSFSVDGLTSEDNRILAMGAGQPLEPGTYYIGVINNAGAAAMSYTLKSRGIGDGMTIPIIDLNYTGGSVTVSNLPAREAAYFRVQVPPDSPGWKMKLEPIIGEAMLVVLSNHVPNVDSGRLSGILNGKFMQKAGNEHYLILPLPGQSNIISGTYYLAAVSEGVNPATATRIGSGSSTFTLTSVGDVPITQLGTVSPVDLVVTNSLEGGEVQMYQFSVPLTVPAVEMRLENRIGNPVMVVLTNALLPDPGLLSSPKDSYGNDFGLPPNDINTNILTIANPTNGIYTLAVKARIVGTAYPDASYTLRVRQMQVPELNFTPEFNTNGLSNIGTGLLIDNQRAYYKVVVPTNVNGQPVIGWQLDLSQSSGQAGLRVRKDALPSDPVVGMPQTPNQAVIAAPFLTNGTWYVEVRGTNTTSYTLISSALKLQRPAWQMPVVGGPSTTPGLTAPDFGDTGVTTNGTALPGDQGTDLDLGSYHYYAITVPTNNGGLLRVALEAISGNPDFYLRMGLPPTVSHTSNGLAGVTYERYLTGNTTEYGNFVPLNGKTEPRLTPGTWYLAVRAVANANARYRLKLSTGFIQDLPLDGGTLTGQTVAGSDWRYYRVQLPLDMPQNWNVTFSQEAGDVVMHVRDTIPPGNGNSTNTVDYKDWFSDAKNDGPYSSYDAANTYTFTEPPVRPDSVYYLGFRAKNDAIFTVSSSISGGTNFAPPIIPFYGGSVTNYIPPTNQVAYRIYTPADALRWRHTSVHSNSVFVYMENGTLPTKSNSDDYRSATANSSQDRFLTSYPWWSNQVFYVVVTNTSSATQYFNFNMNGSSITADDDADGMLDLWELQYFNTLAQLPNTDFDGDGVSNLNEYNDGTSPTDKNAFRPRLFIFATNGVVTVNPPTNSFFFGDVASLTATPNPGFLFLGWTGQVSGTANPLQVTMSTNRTIIPRFRSPGDDFDQRIGLFGLNANYSLSSTGATKQAGEPNHAGNVGGRSVWFTWTAPASGPVSVNTAGSSFRNMLAVYTGAAVNALTVVASNLPPVSTNTVTVNFTAVGGTTYQMAVDGFNGTNGNVTVNLTMPGSGIVLSSPVRADDGLFHFTITSPAGLVLRIDASTNLTSWTPIDLVTNVTGVMDYADTDSPNYVLRYYRVVVPGPGVPSLTLANFQRLPDGNFRFTILGNAGPSVTVQAVNSLTNSNGWTALTNYSNFGGGTVFTDQTATNYSQRIYRAISP